MRGFRPGAGAKAPLCRCGRNLAQTQMAANDGCSIATSAPVLLELYLGHSLDEKCGLRLCHGNAVKKIKRDNRH